MLIVGALHVGVSAGGVETAGKYMPKAVCLQFRPHACFVAIVSAMEVRRHSHLQPCRWKLPKTFCSSAVVAQLLAIQSSHGWKTTSASTYVRTYVRICDCQILQITTAQGLSVFMHPPAVMAEAMLHARILAARALKTSNDGTPEAAQQSEASGEPAAKACRAGEGVGDGVPAGIAPSSQGAGNGSVALAAFSKASGRGEDRSAFVHGKDGRNQPQVPDARGPSATSGVRDGGGLLDPADSQLQAAKQLVEKYKVSEGMQLPPQLVGFDVANRDGIPLNGDRCDELLGRISVMGWDSDEANFGNICVQERPSATELLEYNRRACAASEYLADVTTDQILYGTLTHSHLHQCLKNIAGSAAAAKPEAFMNGGNLSLHACTQAQPALAEAVTHGLKWTVLKWTIRDEKGAMELIQGAHNRKAGVAMKESPLQAISRLSAICSALAGSGGYVHPDQARARMQKTMPEYAGGEFYGLMRFVVNLGAQQAPFIKNLKEFVGLRGKNRQVRAATFALAGQLPSSLPHLVSGLVVMAYTAPDQAFSDGYSKYLTANDLKFLMVRCDNGKTMPTEPATHAENVLRWFHTACDQLDGHYPRGTILDYMSMLDSCVCRMLTDKHIGGAFGESCDSVNELADAFKKEFVKLFPNHNPTALAGEQPWTTVMTGKKRKAPPKKISQEPDLAPKILQFRGGIAETTQDEVTREIEEEYVDWAKTITFQEDDLTRMVVLLCLQQLVRATTALMQDVVGLKRTNMGDILVFAKKDLEMGEVVLAPAAAGLGNVVLPKDKIPNNCARCEVGGREFMITACSRWPPRGQEVKDCEKPSFLPPYWLLHKTPIPDNANCMPDELQLKISRSGALRGDLVEVPAGKLEDVMTVTIPVITNRIPVKKDQELILEIDAPAKRMRTEKRFQWDQLKKYRK